MSTNHCTAIAILWRSMACFFRCFGEEDADLCRLASSNSDLSASLEPVVFSNQKSPFLFQSEDGEREEAVLGESDNVASRAPSPERDYLELKNEAIFLKACGTIQATPDEIKKSCKKLKDSAEHIPELLNFHSWLSSMSTSKLLENDQLPGQPTKPVGSHEETETQAPMDSPTSSFKINDQRDLRVSISSPEDEATDTSNSPCTAACKSVFRDRSVRFDTGSVLSERSPLACIKNMEKPFLRGDGDLSKHSPYPTPLNLSDDMQTPGTVFASGNNARIRSQYVYAALNPPEFTDHPSISQRVSLGAPHGAFIQNDLTGETDLPSSFKPAASIRVGKDIKYSPILGLVAEHWKDDENVSPIWSNEWGSNRLLDSTTKCNEDQKIHWKATPFVERLEETLYGDNFI